jgi:hypothetical protein
VPSSVITTEELVFITEEADQSVLSETLETTIFFTVGHQGPPGPEGQIGPAGGSTLQRTAGATLSAMVAVYELDAEVFALDKDDDANIDQFLGLTVTAADIGNTINVQRTGAVDNSGWAWTPGRVYLGASGALTQTPATSGNDVLIGRAVSATRLLLDLQDPIDLE